TSRASGSSKSSSLPASSDRRRLAGFCSGEPGKRRRRRPNRLRDRCAWSVRMIRVFVCCLSLFAAVPAAAQSPAAIEQQIRDLEQKYTAGYAANDLPTYFSYLADDFGQWLPSGRTDKASYQTSWTRFVTGGGKVLSAELSDVQVKVSPAGDTAV